jgi:hypothetical protein
MSTPLQIALTLAAKGCRVFQARPTTKAPFPKAWPQQSTTDTKTIEKWFGGKRKYAVGVHTVGLVVFDIDGPFGHENLLRLQAKYGELPPTLKVISGNEEPHHYHLYYKLPAGKRVKGRDLHCFDCCVDLLILDEKGKSKIDIKGSGGLVIGAGTQHKSGNYYHWEREPANVYEEATLAPDWVIELMAEPEDDKYTTDYHLAGLPVPSEFFRNKKAPSPLSGAMPSAGVIPGVGSDDEFYNILVNRWPIAPGNRHAQIGKAVGYLVGKKLPEERITSIATSWVNSFDCETDEQEIERDLLSTIERFCEKVESGEFKVMVDHQELTVKEELPLPLSKWLSTFCDGKAVISGGESSPLETDTQHFEHRPRGLCSNIRYKRIGEVDRDLLLSLLYHANYMRKKGVNNILPMTHRQLIVIHQKLNPDKKLNVSSVSNFLSKFASKQTQEGLRKASVKELLKLETTGTFGKPSTYSLTGLLEAFEGVDHDGDRRGFGELVGCDVRVQRSLPTDSPVSNGTTSYGELYPLVADAGNDASALRSDGDSEQDNRLRHNQQDLLADSDVSHGTDFEVGGCTERHEVVADREACAESVDVPKMREADHVDESDAVVERTQLYADDMWDVPEDSDDFWLDAYEYLASYDDRDESYDDLACAVYYGRDREEREEACYSASVDE